VITLSIEFLAGRFHATPWDSALREGNVEWPPSPWRLLRAIIAGWHSAGAEDVACLRAVLDRLSVPPRFELPPWTASHPRHYTPQGSLNGTHIDRALVLDAFVAFAESQTTAYIIWDDVTLSAQESLLLERACAAIGYLGRTQSSCRITSLTSVAPIDPELVHVDLASRSTQPGIPIRRLGVAADMRGAGLLRALSATTSEIRRGQRVPQGSTWLEYSLPPQRTNVAEDARPDSLLPAHVERFALEAPTTALLPLMTDTILVAELMRKAIMKTYSNRWGNEVAPAILTGKSADSSPALAHRHAYFLPRDLDDDGKIDHIDIRLPTDYPHRVHAALMAVRQLWSRQLGLAIDQRFLVANMGHAPLETSRTWETLTPFVLERHPHAHRDQPEEQIRRSLLHHGFPGDVNVEVYPKAGWGKRSMCAQLDAFRRTRKQDPIFPAIGARLTFTDPQTGPIALGRYAHFGLGQFAQCE
jgi:CRISPR-associated protein Csb2